LSNYAFIYYLIEYNIQKEAIHERLDNPSIANDERVFSLRNYTNAMDRFLEMQVDPLCIDIVLSKDSKFK